MKAHRPSDRKSTRKQPAPNVGIPQDFTLVAPESATLKRPPTTETSESAPATAHVLPSNYLDFSRFQVYWWLHHVTRVLRKMHGNHPLFDAQWQARGLL